MHKPPIVSIVIPVYNVSPYLRSCLDSVVQQTMREIQIICVDDGSTDDSLKILEEYQSKDNRIEVISQKNQGPAAARNTAMRLVRGEYVSFIDADDWVDHSLCQKAYQHAKASGAEITFFYLKRPGKKRSIPRFQRISLQGKTTPEDKFPLFEYSFPWLKIFKADFLRDNAIDFPDGIYFEDVFFHWKTMVLAKKVTILPEVLYYYRFRSDSIIGERGKCYLDVVPIFDRIKAFLIETGNYEAYQQEFLRCKYDIYQRHYQHISRSLRPEMKARILASFVPEEHAVFDQLKPRLSGRAKDFFAALRGDKFAKIHYHWRIFTYSVERRIVCTYNALERVLRKLFRNKENDEQS